MALPFILGLAVGAGVVIAFNKSDKLKEHLSTSVDKTKEFAACGMEKAKDIAADVKETVSTTIRCKKDKDDTIYESSETKTKTKIEIEKEEEK